MTQLLERAFAAASKLPDREQDAGLPYSAVIEADTSDTQRVIFEQMSEAALIEIRLPTQKFTEI
ncbi:MAG TPA: hypothetical protein VIT91_03655 [Chthoniobacterales bacterium]